MEPISVYIYLGLGTNLGDRAANLKQAIKLLSQGRVTLTRCSSIYQTAPWGFADQPPFLNCVLEAQTTLSPTDLLQATQGVEQEMGRQPTFRNGPRLIDVDILLYGDAVVDKPELQIPHPRLGQRAFVLVPLTELAPNLVHPTLRQTIQELKQAVAGIEGVIHWGPAFAL